MELHDDPGSTLMCMGLLPWLVITLRVLWNEVCPSIAVSVIKLLSVLDIGFTVVKWLTCCGGIYVVMSWLRCVFISPVLLIVLLQFLVVLGFNVCILAVAPVTV